jgi:hypothetical protein
MKKNLLFSFIFLSTVSLYAQNDSLRLQNPKRNILKINLLSPILNSFSASYERVINDEKTFNITAFVSQNFAGDNIVAYGITPEIRFYLSENKKAPAGFFVAPYFTLQTYGGDPIILGPGVAIGGQWVFKNRVSLDLWGGPAYVFTNDNSEFLGNFWGRFGLSLGFLFR